MTQVKMNARTRRCQHMPGIVVENLMLMKAMHAPAAERRTSSLHEDGGFLRRINQHGSAHHSGGQSPQRVLERPWWYTLRISLEAVKHALITYGAGRIPIRLSPARANFEHFIRRPSRKAKSFPARLHVLNTHFV